MIDLIAILPTADVQDEATHTYLNSERPSNPIANFLASYIPIVSLVLSIILLLSLTHMYTALFLPAHLRVQAHLPNKDDLAGQDGLLANN